MNEERIQKVLSDEEYVKTLMELETPEEVQKALAEKEINLTLEEIKTIAELVQKKTNGELTDEDLEKVAGGLPGIEIACIVVAALAVVNTVFSFIRRW